MMDEPMKDKRSLEILLSLTPSAANGDDIVTKASRDLLLTCIKTDVRVHTVFFPHITSHPLQEKLDLRTFPMEPLAVTFVSEAIVNVKDVYQFHSTINRSALDRGLRDIYESLQWKKLGFQMYTLVYPEVVRDVESGLSLKHFMGDDGYVWAERLIQQLQDPKWTSRIQQRIIRGLYSEEDYNKDMNALFVKLHLLDPQSVIPAYQFLLNQRALPVVNLELATRNYLGGRLDWRTIQFEVENAERKPTTPISSAAKLQQMKEERRDDGLEVFYGVAVDDFIVTECRNLGLWSGLRPDNVRIAKPGRKCRMM